MKAQGLAEPDAKRLAVRASRLTAWPTLGALWFDGYLSGPQVDAVVALVPKRLVDLYGSHDAEVSPLLVGLSLVDTTAAVRHWVARAEAVSDETEPAGSEATGSQVHLSRTLDGRAIVDAELDPDTAAVAEVALRIAERPDQPGEFRTAAQRRGDAFGTVVRFFCDHYAELGARPGRQHPHVAVTIDPDELIAGALRGLGIDSAEDLERLLAARMSGSSRKPCSATRSPTRRERRSTTTADRSPPTAWRDCSPKTLSSTECSWRKGRSSTAAATSGWRHRPCATPWSCATGAAGSRTATPPPRWVHAHHLHHWDDGGQTDLANLAGLCATHHGVVHRQGWELELEPDGTLLFRRPDGHTLTSPPPRRHRPPPLPLHHPKTRGLIPEFPDRTPPTKPAAEHERGRAHHPEPEPGDTSEPDEHETTRIVRARVVDFVQRHHRRRPADHPTDPDTWFEAS